MFTSGIYVEVGVLFINNCMSQNSIPYFLFYKGISAVKNHGTYEIDILLSP